MRKGDSRLKWKVFPVHLPWMVGDAMKRAAEHYELSQSGFLRSVLETFLWKQGFLPADYFRVLSQQQEKSHGRART